LFLFLFPPLYDLGLAAVNRLLAAASMELPILLWFHFAPYARKIETQKKIMYRSAEGSILNCISRVIIGLALWREAASPNLQCGRPRTSWAIIRSLRKSAIRNQARV
jgi:hypothetical protein